MHARRVAMIDFRILALQIHHLILLTMTTTTPSLTNLTEAASQAGPGSLYVAESLWKFSSGKQEPSHEPAKSGFSLANIDKSDKPQTF